MPSGTGDLEASTPTDDKGPLENLREIHQKALDDLVNVNSLFTLAVFVGLSMARQGERSLENRTECDADVGNARRLVVNEVVSFACFLLSSLVAKALKIHVTICQEEDFKNTRNQSVRFSMLMLSVWASVFGCIFLTVSMVDVIQIKVGKLSCRSVHAWRAAGALIAIVLLALSIYVPFMMTAIFTSVRNVQRKVDKK
ncbi:hypothetical protein ERO13_A07G195900v2 [Gossypium hirsutum]|uniref:PGG domain-containing protein n=5 Tax=Gossypium TaxID=3633 RepID=A0A1U8PC47_GOSHI|nr:uncharacterized protein LOC107956867 [Gossypium hirsutum]KAB2075297.1 hypothetical protein ES319_A07G213100v1 [Gossypium barbadense]TYH11098.1 hypothetical protein ES288_A07G231300v1 [Gossypium darwinii]TYI20320.1 hypothetical protein ES332_A07G229000v1 [Gossypium tomentosum]TYJ27907.1 hypothetical protein E1A91_A07G221400v1 [Gossypium mustelinum]KAG4193047.1 hypothetical protein ERO13_A07G195900v2 [Gossypium hirsutum]